MNQADIALQYALAQIGKPYCWGGTGPNCFDCSGLVMMAYQTAGVVLPRTTYQQVGQGQPIANGDLAPGDLVFPDPGHVQLYVGANTIVEAATSGTPVRTVAMWGFWQGRRVTAPGGPIGLIGATSPTAPGCLGILLGKK
jgi:cell wall-associated NlpC family hydrolase